MDDKLKDPERFIGLTAEGQVAEPDAATLEQVLALKLASQGLFAPPASHALRQVAGDLFERYAEQQRLLAHHLPPVDARIQAFLIEVADAASESRVALPTQTLVMDRYGLARSLSLPIGQNEYQNEEVSSYRINNGVLHNPASDRRTTEGVFHVADYGFSVPADKLAVPLVTYVRMLRAALTPPSALAVLPYTASWDKPVETMVSLLLRPLVCPEIPGVRPERRSEIRFFAPGGLVSNLDFVESIFGNGGDPFLPQNDAALDSLHWSGHTGAVILAPHLRGLRKIDVGLPHYDQASPRQRAEGMCYRDPAELYNGGRAFKLTVRTKAGIMVTILADNYFGYCKKEVKTQISFAANLGGMAEEEHSGGALAFASFSLGQKFIPDARMVGSGHHYSEAVQLLGDSVQVDPRGFATDRRYPNVHILPEDAEIDLGTQEASWQKDGKREKVRVLLGHHYLHPSGYKVRLEEHPSGHGYRLVGTTAEGTFVHKPCTVSGGGKSEISKSLEDVVLYAPIFVGDVESDIALIDAILSRDYSGVLQRPTDLERDSRRPILSPERSLGSVIKLLTPSEALYTREHNEFLAQIPHHVLALVFAIKRFYEPSWDGDWKSHFTVDIVDGESGHEWNLDGKKLMGAYLRVGLRAGGRWRTYKLRQDFVPADKVQMEDDITASVVVPRAALPHVPKQYDQHPSLKLAENCEFRLFQRPDDAIHPGFDKQAERDMAAPGLFVSNYQPLAPTEMNDLLEQVRLSQAFTPPMREHIRKASRSDRRNVCSAKPRLVDGKPTKNPRYLQLRPDIARPIDRHLAELGARLSRRVPADKKVVFPVTSVLSGRRNNPPDEIGGKRILPLCVYGPIHYQELPELFMDYVCSVTGKSPSTTGAGSEGALTKGPFNALSGAIDLNSALLSMILTGYGGFSTAAGYIGPNVRVDHDVSLLVPEIWCRLFPEERDPALMLERGELEPVVDFEWEGRKIEASRLGYRITSRFVHKYFGRVFDHPVAVFGEEFLRPESQSQAIFAEGVENIVDAQRRAAELYFQDGGIALACPPLRALLHIMAHGHFEGLTLKDAAVRRMFERSEVLESSWYRARLKTQVAREEALLVRHLEALQAFLAKPAYAAEAENLELGKRKAWVEQELGRVRKAGYLESLVGTIGADPCAPV